MADIEINGYTFKERPTTIDVHRHGNGGLMCIIQKDKVEDFVQAVCEFYLEKGETLSGG